MSLDAIVLLGSKLGPRGKLYGATLRRAKRALLAYESRIASLVVPSGGQRWYGVSEAQAYAAYLTLHGVPEANILCEGGSLSTLENAKCCAGLLRPLGQGRIGLVTCPWHMPRAARRFREVGFDVTELPTFDPGVHGRRYLQLMLREGLAEAADRLRLFTRQIERILG